MNVLLWITGGFVTIGLITLLSMKKGMEERIALAMEGNESTGNQEVSTKLVIWWISGAVLWGIISIFLIVWSFAVYI